VGRGDGALVVQAAGGCGSPTARMDWVTCGMDAGGGGKWRAGCGYEGALVRTRPGAAVVEQAVAHTWWRGEMGRGKHVLAVQRGRRRDETRVCLSVG